MYTFISDDLLYIYDTILSYIYIVYIIYIYTVSDDLPFFAIFWIHLRCVGPAPPTTKGSSELSHQGGQRGLLLLGSEAKETTPKR